MAAVCQLSSNWFGLLVSWADNKKKSNLMLVVLEPGPNAIPWLGDLRQLTICPTESNQSGKHSILHIAINHFQYTLSLHRNHIKQFIFYSNQFRT